MDLSRREFVFRTAPATAAVAAAVVATGSLPASAQTDDAAVVRTVAAMEGGAHRAYELVSSLPVLAAPAANAFLREFVSTTRDQHAARRNEFQSLATQLGEGAAVAPEAALVDVAVAAQSRLRQSTDVAQVLLDVELRLADAYLNANSGALASQVRRTVAAAGGVQATAVATLRVIAALAGQGDDYIALPFDLTKPPANLHAAVLPVDRWNKGAAK